MDTKLRDLERQALTDPEARLRFVAEKMRLGYQERQEQIASLYLSHQAYTPEEFSEAINSKIKAKHREKYHRFALNFMGNHHCSPDPYDNYHYCDESDVSLTVAITGIRLETEKELKKRRKLEEKQEEARKQQARRERQQRKKIKESREQQERETYERLKRKFETEEKIERLLASIGPDAEASLKEYSLSYFKSWFNRKFRKLEGKTPVEVFDEGDIEKLRLFALKAL